MRVREGLCPSPAPFAPEGLWGPGLNPRPLLPLTTALPLAGATPAAADPITGAVAAISAGLSWLGGTTVGAFILRTAVSFGLSTLANMLSLSLIHI